MRIRRVSLVAQSLLYMAAGVNHFWHESFYRRIMPGHYSHPDGWVLFTGAAEILGGLGLLHPKTRRATAIGIVMMLISYFDVHIFMLRHAERFPEVPRWLLDARIPLQFVLVAWALQFAGKEKQLPDRDTPN
jgi:uncharacterized membrane protein